MMELRRLKLKDAKYMLEWMKDTELVKYMGTNFGNKTVEDCEYFIKTNQDNPLNIHWAIVNEKDEYMGTVSLKNIEKTEAEFAIVIRRCAMGKGYSRYAMEECIKYAFQHMGLKKVYWYVSSANERAIRFYEKNGYQRYDELNEKSRLRLNSNVEYRWYAVYNV